jgi:hypothetical protein
MLGNFMNINESPSNGSKEKSNVVIAFEAKESAEKLAKELDEYLNKNSKVKQSLFGKWINSLTSGEAVADLQLATARKLREVRNGW